MSFVSHLRRGVYALHWCVGITLSVTFLPSPALGQTTLAQAEVAYRQAVAEYEANQSAMEDASLDWEQANERVGTARGTDGEESARAASHEAALALMSLEAQTEESLVRVEEARGRWLALLEQRELEILAQRSANPSPPLLDRLADELLQVRGLVAELEAEARSAGPAPLRPVPELVVDPRDGIEDLLAKQDLMEDQVSFYESLIADYDTEIQELQTDLQRNQNVEDFLRSVQRFGSDLVAGAPLPPTASDGGANDPGQGAAADTAADGAVAASLASLPLEERIQNLREIRALAVEYRDQAVQMANTFRALAQGGDP